MKRYVLIRCRRGGDGQADEVQRIPKAGLVALTKSLALEFGPAGITVNTIPSGFIDTPMPRASEEHGLLGGSVDHHAAQTPVRRAGRPEDIASVCVPGFGRGRLHHRPDHRRQRRPQHVRVLCKWLAYLL